MFVCLFVHGGVFCCSYCGFLFLFGGDIFRLFVCLFLGVFLRNKHLYLQYCVLFKGMFVIYGHQ